MSRYFWEPFSDQYSAAAAVRMLSGITMSLANWQVSVHVILAAASGLKTVCLAAAGHCQYPCVSVFSRLLCCVL